MYRKYKKGPSPSDVQEQPDPIEDSVRSTVCDVWSTIEKQCIDIAEKSEEVRTIQDTTSEWKIVRVFISSTFTDFFSEREVLVKKVFPELRDWCYKRSLKFVECDLRWGIPKETPSQETVLVCLEEIDKCKESNNNQPFFLNLIGERYGWIPSKEEIPLEAKEKYSWVDGTSITFMEILHGAYRDQNPNALFLMRDSSVCNEIPEKFQQRFVDMEPLSKHHLKVMKEKIKQRFPHQVFPYKCNFKQISSASGREQVELTDYEEFAEKVIDFFKDAIASMYPPHEPKSVDPLKQETELQTLFAMDRCQDVIGRESELETLLNYLDKGDSKKLEKTDGAESSIRLKSDWDLHDTDKKLCVVQAPNGWGKSSLMCRLITHCIQRDDVDVFYHIVGSTPSSNRTNTLLNRLIQALTMEDKLDETSAPTDQYGKLRRALSMYREKAKDGKRLYIIIDGINQLDTSETVQHLSWLPPSFPHNIRCIVSTNTHLPTLARLYEHPTLKLILSTMSSEHLTQVAVKYLQNFNKRLDKDQIKKLLDKTSVNNPLWMLLVAEELRVFGDFRQLDQKIDDLPDTLDGQLGQIIERLIAEDDENGVVKKILCLVACSRNGLPSDHALRVCGNVKEKEELPPLYWARAKRSLKVYLRTTGLLEDYIIFSHEAVAKAVYHHLLKADDDIIYWHTQLADFYQYWCEDSVMRALNLPYHLEAAKLRKRLAEFLSTDPASYRHLAPWQRSDLVRKLRCRGLADPVIPNTAPVLLCKFCASRNSGYNPACMWQNKMCCVLCGSLCNTPQGCVEARACMMHSNRLNANTFKCRLCSGQAQLNTNPGPLSGTPGKLCIHCSLE